MSSIMRTRISPVLCSRQAYAFCKECCISFSSMLYVRAVEEIVQPQRNWWREQFVCSPQPSQHMHYSALPCYQSAPLHTMPCHTLHTRRFSALVCLDPPLLELVDVLLIGLGQLLDFLLFDPFQQILLDPELARDHRLAIIIGRQIPRHMSHGPLGEDVLLFVVEILLLHPPHDVAGLPYGALRERDGEVDHAHGEEVLPGRLVKSGTEILDIVDVAGDDGSEEGVLLLLAFLARELAAAL
mmetsp:Transcript_782/g.2214  ORF Transcript_782/g.2214 Transcript_782/m.2214 type:complete len:241 (-) Transcript_782:174-896(-)